MEELKKNVEKQKANWNIKPYLAIGLTAFIVIIASISVFFMIYRYHEVSMLWGRIMVIMQPILIGLVLAYLVTPIVNFEEKHLRKLVVKKWKNPPKSRGIIRAVSVAGALLFVALIIGILLKMVIPELYRSIESMIETLPRQVNSFLKTMENYTKEDSQLAEYMEIALKQGTQYFEHWAQTQFLPQTKTLLTSLTTGVITAVKLLFNVVIGIIISIYVLMSKEIFVGQAKKLTYAILPAKQANAVVRTVHKSHQIFGGFISGKILDSFIIGLLCFVILSLLQMPYTVLVSVIVGVTNVIPFFGPYLGAIPSTILIMLASPIQGIYFIIFILILQQVDGNIIGPKILGDSTGLSSFWVVFAILIGGGLFGIPGMIMGVPVFAVVYYIVRNIIHYILQRKRLPEETEQYIDVKELDMKNHTLVYTRKQETEAKEKSEKKPGK